MTPTSQAASTAPGLYLHVPFCSAICPYCDFAVLRGSRTQREGFVDLLLGEARLEHSIGGFDTIYLGGGTPSSLAPSELARLLEELQGILHVSERAWLALEANPEDASRESLRAWRDLGIDFLSLGVQALDDRDLRFLGRRHTEREGRRSVELAREAGFSVVSLDLIYCLPQRSSARWRQTLEAAVGLGPDHLSCYELTFHDGTPFGRALGAGRLRELEQDERAEHFELTHQVLADLGYEAYEVSNFARTPDHRSRHNQKYWQHLPYLGLGPSAHSFDGARRWWNHRALHDYQRCVEAGRSPVAEIEELTREQLVLEHLLVSLRTPRGLDLEGLRERFGVDLLAARGREVGEASSSGLLRLEAGRLAPTLRGLAVAEALAVRLSP